MGSFERQPVQLIAPDRCLEYVFIKQAFPRTVHDLDSARTDVLHNAIGVPQVAELRSRALERWWVLACVRELVDEFACLITSGSFQPTTLVTQEQLLESELNLSSVFQIGNDP